MTAAAAPARTKTPSRDRAKSATRRRVKSPTRKHSNLRTRKRAIPSARTPTEAVADNQPAIGQIPGDRRRLAAIRRTLLKWYDAHARDLPWRRRSGDPYAQWVAEIMLQQTQVETVIPYYERFMRSFPTVRALAAAPNQRLMQHWQGLGYYRRAEHLHRAAKTIAADGGALPSNADELRALPGIGRYTAGAIASIAFGKRSAAVDGNVARVLSRLFAIDEDVKSTGVVRRLWDWAEALLPRTRCADFNQAWMDLGAAVCTPARPNCEACPLRNHCLARTLNMTDRLPRNGAPQVVRSVKTIVAVVKHENRYLMRRRPPGGLWSGLWEFPNVEHGTRPSAARQISALLKSYGLPRISTPKPIGQLTHRLTHRIIQFDVFRCDAIQRGGGPAARAEENRDAARWVSVRQQRQLPTSTATRRVLRLLDSCEAG